MRLTRRAFAGVLGVGAVVYLAGEAITPNTDLAVVDKYTGEIASRTAFATASHIESAIAAGFEAIGPTAEMGAYERKAVLRHCVARFGQRRDELAYALCVEAGKPISDSEGEVTRLIETFEIASEESVRIGGEVTSLRQLASRFGRLARLSRAIARIFELR